MINVAEIRKDFPLLSSIVNGRPLIYLDNAATTQLPLCVLNKMQNHYLHNNGNVHRGIHELSKRSTNGYEGARKTVQEFLGASSENEIIFTQGTTDSIHLVAASLEHQLTHQDFILTTDMEHHSNFLPWQRLCQRTGAGFSVLKCPEGQPDLIEYQRLLEKKPKLVAFSQVTNLTGTVMPTKEMTALAHAAGALVLVDGAQGIRHANTNLQQDDFDFYCFSGHKAMAPTGIGVLYGKSSLLNQLEPPRVGGGMVDMVDETGFTCAPLPSKWEAGTPNYMGAIALGEALQYMATMGKEAIAAYEDELLAYAQHKLTNIQELTMLGHPQRRAGVISFNIEGVHPYDAASILDQYGVAVRSGTHCAQPALHRLGAKLAIRLSPAFYNTFAEIDQTVEYMGLMLERMSRWRQK